MRRTRSRLYYHIVWATKQREPWIDDQIKPRVLGAIEAKCLELGVSIYALNAVADHVHLCCTIPPSIAIAIAVRDIKGSAFHMVNQETNLSFRFCWQEGYGVTSLSADHLQRVVNYIANQEEHHRKADLLASLEECDEESPSAR